MAIWSMGSQTQILIGYLPVPAPLLCKYWTSTFFTVTCIWKKKKKEKKIRRESESSCCWGGDVENRHGWVDLQRANSPHPPFIISQLPPSSYPRNLQPTSATHTQFLRHSGQREKSADRDAFVSSYTAGIACIEGDLKKKKRKTLNI